MCLLRSTIKRDACRMGLYCMHLNLIPYTTTFKNILMQLDFNLTIPEDLNIYYISIYNKGQVFVGNPRGIFGSSALYESKPIGRAEKYVYHHAYPLKQIHWKMLNQENQPCDEDNTEGNTTECIMDFLERSVGCSLILQGRNRKLDLYNSKNLPPKFILNMLKCLVKLQMPQGRSSYRIRKMG